MVSILLNQGEASPSDVKLYNLQNDQPPAPPAPRAAVQIFLSSIANQIVQSIVLSKLIPDIFLRQGEASPADVRLYDTAAESANALVKFLTIDLILRDVTKSLAGTSNGSLSVQETADSAALSIAVIIDGSLAAAEALDVSSMNCKDVVDGSLAASEAADIAGISGAVLIQGSIAVAEAADLVAFQAVVRIMGAIPDYEFPSKIIFNRFLFSFVSPFLSVQSIIKNQYYRSNMNSSPQFISRIRTEANFISIIGEPDGS